MSTPRSRSKHTVWLPVALLRFDPRVNRSVRQWQVDKIVNEFNPDSFGVLQVSHRDDGSHVVLAGQHRVLAFLQMGYDDQKVECQVFEGLTIEEEARIAREANLTRRNEPIDNFNSRVTERDPIALAIAAIVESNELVIDPQPRDGNIACVTAMLKVYSGVRFAADREQPKALDRTLHVLTAAWGRTRAAVQGALVEGTGYVFLRYGETVDVDRLVAKLGPLPGAGAGMLSRARAARETHGGSVADNVAAVAVVTYNKGTRTGGLGDWWSS